MSPSELANWLIKENVVSSDKPEVLLSMIMYEHKIRAVSWPFCDEIAGELVYHRKRWFICLNCDLSATDRIVTIAHLLYRYLVHRQQAQRLICHKMPNISSKAEEDGYKFASVLLNYYDTNKMTTQLKIAEQNTQYRI